MKKIMMIMVMAVLALQGQAQFTKARLQASGLTCSMCNNAIYKALKALPYVASVDSDIKNAAFDIVFKPGMTADFDGLKNAVEDAGFSVASLKITGTFDNVSVVSDKHVQIGDRHFHFIQVKDQVLNGEQTITIIDKDFLTTKSFKKYSAATKKTCMQSGKATAGCCEGEGVTAGTRIYHVTI
jgi:copper chaperone CopZ